MFVDYKYYKENWNGSMNEEEFIKINKEQEALLDSKMDNIIFYEHVNNYPDKIQNLIKDCICENCDYINETENLEGILNSYSINGVSMSFNNNQNINTSLYIKKSVYQKLVRVGLINSIA